MRRGEGNAGDLSNSRYDLQRGDGSGSLPPQARIGRYRNEVRKQPTANLPDDGGGKAKLGHRGCGPGAPTTGVSAVRAGSAFRQSGAVSRPRALVRSQRAKLAGGSGLVMKLGPCDAAGLVGVLRRRTRQILPRERPVVRRTATGAPCRADIEKVVLRGFASAGRCERLKARSWPARPFQVRYFRTKPSVRIVCAFIPELDGDGRERRGVRRRGRRARRGRREAQDHTAGIFVIG